MEGSDTNGEIAADQVPEGEVIRLQWERSRIAQDRFYDLTVLLTPIIIKRVLGCISIEMHDIQILTVGVSITVKLIIPKLKPEKVEDLSVQYFLLNN